MITLEENWERAFESPFRTAVEGLLPAFLTSSRWFGGKAKTISSTIISDVLPVGTASATMVLILVEVSYAEGNPESYAIVVTAALDAEADRIEREHANAVIGALNVVRAGENHRGVLYDALWSRDCAYELLSSMGRRARIPGSSGDLVGSATALFDGMQVQLTTSPITVMKGEQSNTSVRFGDHVMMKLYRRTEPGTNPELEIGRTLTSRGFSHSPGLVGALEYIRGNDEPNTLALAQTFIANQGNAWDYTLSQLSHYFSRVAALEPQDVSHPRGVGGHSHPPAPTDLFFGFIDEARLLGRRTGELHRVLSEPSHEPAFTPETCSSTYVLDRIQAMRRAATRALTLLHSRLPALSESDRDLAKTVLQREAAVLSRFESLHRTPLTAMRIRCHGDYHLGQVLYTGQDFIIIDFEGEPARPLRERRSKHLPIVDVAGMIRSFHYAAHMALRQRTVHQPISLATSRLNTWAEQWYQSVRAAFLSGYRAVAGEAPFSPQSRQEFDLLLEVHVLDKVMYELTYELNNRPEWIALPLTGIMQCMDSPTASEEQDQPRDQPIERETDACNPRATGQANDEVNQ